jgi:hypothetical protein
MRGLVGVMQDMGQFDDNSMSMQVRGYGADDPCVMDMQVCAEANNAKDVLSFSFDATGQVGTTVSTTWELLTMIVIQYDV